MAQKIKSNLGFFVFICFIFIALTIIWTFPLVVRLKTSIFADGKWLFDIPVAIYGTWLNKMTWLGFVPSNLNNLISYPFGVNISHINREPVLEIPLLMLSLWKNEVFAFNITILSSFFFSAITMFFLAWYFTKNRVASFLSAVIYAFCPFHTLQCFSHMSLAVIQWMPLYILCLFKFGEKISYSRSILCAGVFLLVALSNYYYAYIMFIFTLIFLLINFYKRIKSGFQETSNFTKKFLLMSLIIVVVLMPLNYKAIVTIWKGPDVAVETKVYRHATPVQDLSRYAASIADYIRPSEYHPIFGKVDFWFIKPYTDASRHWAEKTVFLGYVPIILALYFIFGLFRKREKVNGIYPHTKKRHFGVGIYILLISTITAFIISLPPKLGFLPMPSLFLHKIFPMFRCYARFGILVILGMAVFAGLGFKEMMDRYQKRALFTCMITGLVLFEFIVIPPFRNVDFSETPPEYKWLKGLPGKEAIAEYPLLSEMDCDHYKYIFYQMVHKHPLFNGSKAGTLGDAIRLEIRDISEVRSARILSSLGVQYIILHKDGYDESDLAEIEKNEGLTKAADFKDSTVYKIQAISKETEMFFWKNFYSWEEWEGIGNYWIWADNNATIWLAHSEGQFIKKRIRFKAISFAKEREMQICLNDDLVYKTTIKSPSNLSEASEVEFDLSLPPGSNILRFYSLQGGEVIDNVLHNGDKRRVCFGFSKIEL